jgi:hypothetical protein
MQALADGHHTTSLLSQQFITLLLLAMNPEQA